MKHFLWARARTARKTISFQSLLPALKVCVDIEPPQTPSSCNLLRSSSLNHVKRRSTLPGFECPPMTEIEFKDDAHMLALLGLPIFRLEEVARSRH
jgi:hypothetical protein